MTNKIDTKYLMNLSNFKSRLAWFDGLESNLQSFLTEHHLNGVELILFEDEMTLPKEQVMGLHLRYWPYWMDLWLGNTEALIHNLGSEEAIEMVYGGKDRSILIDRYKYELKTAKELEVSYMVFHVSHIGMHEVFTGVYDYTDEEVIDATIELVNQVFDHECEVALLFENLWWPGLRLDRYDIVNRLMNGIHYKNKGLLLDVSHLAIASGDVYDGRTSLNAVIQALDELKEYKDQIRGLHLNGAFPGDGLKNLQVHKESPLIHLDVKEKYKRIIDEVSKLDSHVPFHDHTSKEIIDLIHPEFVVFEVLPKDKDELSSWLKKQNIVLNRERG